MFGEFRINGVTDELNGVEGYDFLEGIECGVTGTGVREGDDPRSTRPGDNRGREYIDKDRAFNAVYRGTTAGAYAAVRAHVTAPQNCWTPLRGRIILQPDLHASCVEKSRLVLFTSGMGITIEVRIRGV